jgi:hypothetical protein
MTCDDVLKQGRAGLSTAMARYHALAMTFSLPQAEAALAQMEEQ